MSKGAVVALIVVFAVIFLFVPVVYNAQLSLVPNLAGQYQSSPDYQSPSCILLGFGAQATASGLVFYSSNCADQRPTG
jgi:hypothetical protein